MQDLLFKHGACAWIAGSGMGAAAVCLSGATRWTNSPMCGTLSRTVFFLEMPSSSHIPRHQSVYHKAGLLLELYENSVTGHILPYISIYLY
jgi:hypothetical protein